MAIPKYNEMYVDYLEALADGQPHKNAEIRATVAAARNLTPEDLALTIPSGRVGLFTDRPPHRYPCPRRPPYRSPDS